MGAAAIACFTSRGDDAAAMTTTRDRVNVNVGVGGDDDDDGDAVLWVTMHVAGAPPQHEQPRRLSLGARSDGRTSALWTTRVATLKRALLVAVRAPLVVDDDSDDHDNHLDDHDHCLPAQERLSPDACDHNAFVLVVVACGRCGRPRGCRCGWRRVHEIPAALESRSLAQLLPRLLPYTSPSDVAMPQSLHLQLVASTRPPGAWLEASVVHFKVVDPMVERPRAVFKINVQFGEKAWSVTRRFQDFATLHATLLASVDPRLLPTLPLTTWFRKLDDPFLHARRKALDRYVCGLLLIDCVRDSVVLLSFLGAISTTHERLLEPATDSRRSIEVLHLRVLQYYVRAGDLLLFQSRGVVSSLQRSATGSEWDHVAVVVPRSHDDDRKGFLLLEATGDGVTALSLATRLYAYSTYHTNRIVLRQLHTPLLTDAVRSDLLDRFTARVKGRPYGLSVSKVLRTNEPRTHDGVPKPDDVGSDFFCSELIADAYKALGLMDVSIPSSNFWPSSFASGAFVDVEIGRHGASLGGTIAVDCLMLEVALAYRASDTL